MLASCEDCIFSLDLAGRLRQASHAALLTLALALALILALALTLTAHLSPFTLALTLPLTLARPTRRSLGSSAP